MISWLTTLVLPTAHAASSGEIAGGALVVMFVLFILLFEVAIWAVAIAGLIFWIFMIVDVTQRQNWEHESDKTTWILVVVLAGAIGALIYYFTVRKKLGPANKKPSK